MNIFKSSDSYASAALKGPPQASCTPLPPTTDSLWALHASAHMRSARAAGLLHLSILFGWFSLSMLFAASFSNFSLFASAAFGSSCRPSVATLLSGVWAAYGLHGLLQPCSYITSGVFHLWHEIGLRSEAGLKRAAGLGLLFAAAPSLITLPASEQIVAPSSFRSSVALLGLASAPWAARSGLAVAPDYWLGASFCCAWFSLPVRAQAGHHAGAGWCFGTAVLKGITRKLRPALVPPAVHASVALSGGHYSLAGSLALTAALSLLFSAALLAAPVFQGLLADCVSAWALFCHHACVALFFLLGAAAHASISAIMFLSRTSQARREREALLAHLTWASTFLGLHAFGLLVHNDTMRALSRAFDSFSDDSLQLRPCLATAAAALISPGLLISHDSFICMAPAAWSTSDFLVFHIHAFSAHVTLLVALKGLAYASDSRFVSSKAALGFRFPCDGPGRGGSCQVSAYDHVYLALFWLYNLLSIILFHSYWRWQGELWGLRFPSAAFLDSHFSAQGGYVQGWLRAFLWAQASQVIQGAPAPAYTLIFLLSHFMWSFSLMFLFSGRGYWQELIEALLWAHLKLQAAPSLKPRALSITQGRAVGVAHFVSGGAGAIWAFAFARLLSA